jgi:hypothetical protein
MDLLEEGREREGENSYLTHSQRKNYNDELNTNNYDNQGINESGYNYPENNNDINENENKNHNVDENENENIKMIDENLLPKSPHFKEDISINNKEKLDNINNQKNQKLKNEEDIIDYNIIGNNKIETPEDLVMTLKEAIEDTKKQYKLMRKEYIDEVKKKNEAQQLLQKCIEDLKLEISLSIRDIQNHSKLNN